MTGGILVIMMEITSNEVFYYSIVDDKSSFCAICLELDEQIDRSCMERALHRASGRFPYFQVKLKTLPDRLVLEENHAEVKLYPYEEGRPFQFEENNDYLYRFSVKDNKLQMGFFHGLTDGQGAISYIKVILSEYYKEMGQQLEAPKDLLDIHAPVDQEETVNPYEKIPADRMPVRKEPVPIYTLPENKMKGYQVYRLKVNEADLMKLAKQSDGSPNSMTALFLGKAIKAIHEASIHENITIAIAVNGKMILNVPKSSVPCLQIIECPFDSKLDKLDIETANTAIRGRIILQGDESVMVPKLASAAMLTKYLSQMPDLETKKKICCGAHDMQRSTADISYAGAIDWGGMAKHIRSCYSFVDTLSLTVEINSINGMFCYAFSQKFESDCYVREFCKLLDEYGVRHSEIEAERLYLS